MANILNIIIICLLFTVACTPKYDMIISGTKTYVSSPAEMEEWVTSNFPSCNVIGMYFDLEDYKNGMFGTGFEYYDHEIARAYGTTETTYVLKVVCKSEIYGYITFVYYKRINNQTWCYQTMFGFNAIERYSE